MSIKEVIYTLPDGKVYWAAFFDGEHWFEPPPPFDPEGMSKEVRDVNPAKKKKMEADLAAAIDYADAQFPDEPYYATPKPPRGGGWAPPVPDPPEPTITVSMSRKVNLGNYESADAFVSMSGVRANMTEEELDPLLETGKLAWDMVRNALIEKVREMREDV
jgi:hypothetical protein